MEKWKIIAGLILVVLVAGCGKVIKPILIPECEPLKEINITVKYNGRFIVSDEDFSKMIMTLNDRKYKYKECANRIKKYNKLAKEKSK